MPRPRRNWVEEQGGLPPYIERIAKHIRREQGYSEGHAIAAAVNACKRMCSTGDLNWPGLQQVNAGSRAEACAAVARWEAMRASAKGRPSISAPARPSAPTKVAPPKQRRKAEPVTRKPWDGSPARFSDEQYRRACVLDRGGDGPVKERYGLPIREPDGTLNSNAVHTAAALFSKVKGASAKALRAAARKLIAAYRQLGEAPPAALLALAGRTTEGRFMSDCFEERMVDVDVDSLEQRGRTVVGYAALYNRLSHDLGGFRERIAPGAFADVLASDPDVRALLNHDPNQVLGRTRSGTLRLSDDAERGLRFELDLPDSPLGQNVREAVKRRDLDGASFRFRVKPDGEQWDGETRTLTQIAELRDCSLATFAAYPDTSIELRTRPDDTPVTPGKEDRMDDERRDGGGLTVEDRTLAPDQDRDVEARVTEAIRAVHKGETRSLTLASGDAITPPDLSTYLWDRLTPQSVALRSGIRVIPTDRKTIQWPRVTADPVPEWVGETEVIPATDPAFDTLEADPKKLAARTEFSNEVLDDSEPEAEGVVRRLMQRALALKLDLAFFQGNPAADDDSIRGLKFVSGIQTLSMGTNGAAISDLDLITDAVGMLEDADVPGPFAIVMRPSVWRQFTKLTDTQGRRLLGDFSRETPPNVDGHRVYTSNQLAADETQGTSNDASSIYIYSTEPDTGPALVRRKDVEILVDRSRLFDKDMSEMRAKTRVDLLVPQVLAVLRITGVRPAGS